MHKPRTLIQSIPQLWNRLFADHSPSTTRISWMGLALVFFVPALLLYGNLSFHLLEPDEGRYAEIPREMAERDVWVVPTLQGEPYLDKPPLMYWLVRISYECFGISEWSARLVPALCVHLTILAVYLLGRRSLGERSALFAALLLTICPGYICVARLLLLDGLLTLCITLSLLCGYEAIRTGRFKLGWWMLAAVASGLGFLTKGPISEILLFPPLVAIAWLNPNLAKVKLRHALLFLAIVVSVNLPWYVAIYSQQPEFLGHFFWEHNVMRFVQPFDHLEPVWYYGPVLIAGLLPAWLIIGSYLRRFATTDPTTVSEERSSANGFWILTGCWCVFFFSISGSKLPTYILPAYPPLCLVLGEHLAKSRWPSVRFRRVGFATMVLLIGAVHLWGLAWYARERSPMAHAEKLERYINDDDAMIVTHPRTCNSVAFGTGRADMKQVRSKDLNELFVVAHFEKRTVVLLTHEHSIDALTEQLPPSLRIVERVNFENENPSALTKLIGTTPWGLCDIAVIEPVNGPQQRAITDPSSRRHTRLQSTSPFAQSLR